MYVTRSKIHEQLQQHKAAWDDPGFQPTWKSLLRLVSRGSSLMSAHTHFLAAISSQRTECFSEHVRLLLIVNLRRMRVLATKQVKQLWMVSQDGTEQLDELISHTKQWISEASDLLDA